MLETCVQIYSNICVIYNKFEKFYSLCDFLKAERNSLTEEEAMYTEMGVSHNIYNLIYRYE